MMLLLAAVLTAFAAGAGSAYYIEHAQVVYMEAALQAQKTKALALLDAANAALVVSQNNTRISNANTDEAHASAVQTINAYDIQLDAIIERMRVSTSRTSSHPALPKDSDTASLSQYAAYTALLSESFIRQLGAESKRANLAAVDKNALLKFVVEDNCGIPR